jgi:hypothetical protein
VTLRNTSVSITMQHNISIRTRSTINLSHKAEYHYAQWLIFIVLLIALMLSVVIPSVVAPFERSWVLTQPGKMRKSQRKYIYWLKQINQLFLFLIFCQKWTINIFDFDLQIIQRFLTKILENGQEHNVA